MRYSQLKDLPVRTSHDQARDSWEPNRRSASQGARAQSRELILAAAPRPGTEAEVEVEVSLRANEPGRLDSSRLIVFASVSDPEAEERPVLLDGVSRISSFAVYNSHQLVRGLGDAAAPAGPFGSQRLNCSIGLGTLRLEVGDTAVARLQLPSTEGALVGLLGPFVPDQPETDLAKWTFEEPHVYVASPSMPISDSSKLLHLTFEEDGIVDLGSLQLSGTLHAKDGGAVDTLPTTIVESIRLPSGQDLIVGGIDDDSTERTLAVPATLFSHVDRLHPWVDLGPMEVLRGQQLSIALRRLDRPSKTHRESIFSAGIRFYPISRPSGPGCRIRPSDFY